jgi:hypothetical protein
VDEGVGRSSARYGFRTQPKNRVLMPQADAVRAVPLTVVCVPSARASRSANSATARFVRSASASMRIIRDCSTFGNRCLFCSNLEPSSVVSCGIVTASLAEQRNKVAAAANSSTRRAAIGESRRRATAKMSPSPKARLRIAQLPIRPLVRPALSLRVDCPRAPRPAPAGCVPRVFVSRAPPVEGPRRLLARCHPRHRSRLRCGLRRCTAVA